MPAARDLVGMTFGRLGVFSLAEPRGEKRYWKCACVCGTECEVAGGNLGISIFSCGCLRVENGRRSRGGLKHGMHGSSEYGAWRAMWHRCTNEKSTAFKNYGGRGITVAAEWRDFRSFYSHIGPRPARTELDRIDNDRGYVPGNVRWTTRSENIKNTRPRERNPAGQFTGRLVARSADDVMRGLG